MYLFIYLCPIAIYTLYLTPINLYTFQFTSTDINLGVKRKFRPRTGYESPDFE
jgi:hypothetical protein